MSRRHALTLALAALPLAAQAPATPAAPPAAAAPQPGGIQVVQGRPVMRKAVLEVSRATVFRGMSVDVSAVEKQAREQLAKAGVEVVRERNADPKDTWLIQMKVYLGKRMEKMYLYNAVLRASLLMDRDLQGNERGKPQRIWFSERVFAKRGPEEADARVLGAARLALEGVLPRPTQAPQATGDREHPRYQPFDPALVTYQAPRPLYPDDVEVRKVYNHVEVDLLVDPKGEPVEVEAQSGPEELLDVSMDNALRWRFKPLVEGGVAQWYVTRIKLTYWEGLPLSQHLADIRRAIDPTELQRRDGSMLTRPDRPPTTPANRRNN